MGYHLFAATAVYWRHLLPDDAYLHHYFLLPLAAATCLMLPRPNSLACKVNLTSCSQMLVTTTWSLLPLASYYLLQVLPHDCRYSLFYASTCLLLQLACYYRLLANTFCMGYHLFSATACLLTLLNFGTAYLLLPLATWYYQLAAAASLLLTIPNATTWLLSTTY